MQPAVTVVIPTRNRSGHLARLAASLRVQTLAAWETVIVDDGSEPGQVAAVEAVAAPDGRFSVRRRRGPPGANRCRNEGVGVARAGLIVFFDDDDLLSPDCLRARVDAMQAHPELDFAVFPYRRFRDSPGDLPDSDGPAACASPLDAFLRLRTPWHTGGIIWRRCFLDRLGAWDERLASWQDWEIGIRALTLGPVYRYCDGPAFHVRVPSERHPTVSGGGWVPAHVRSWPVALQSVTDHLAAARLLDARHRAMLAWLHVFVSERLIVVGEAQAAREIWSWCRERGLSTWAEAALAFPLFLAARFPAMRSRVESLIFHAMASPRFNAAMAALRR